MNHTGFVVTDIERSIEFYRDVMGLELTRTLEREGPAISQVLGVRGDPTSRGRS